MTIGLDALLDTLSSAKDLDAQLVQGGFMTG
jgi:hypothetical protein